MVVRMRDKFATQLGLWCVHLPSNAVFTIFFHRNVWSGDGIKLVNNALIVSGT